MFIDALRLYARNVDSFRYNLLTLEELNCFIMKIVARNHEKKAKKTSKENADRLSNEFLISKNCRVMLIYNL
jgi:hypothetical protein